MSDANLPTDGMELKIVPSKIPKPKFNREKAIDALFEDANRAQKEIFVASRSAVLNAWKAGVLLNQLANILPHGQVQITISERFCKPNNVSMRTVQRYQFIANRCGKLLEELRKANKDLQDLTDEEILSRLTINEAYELSRRLMKIDLDKHPGDTTKVPKPDPNGWVTPKNLAELVGEFLKVVDLDPCSVANENTPLALNQIVAPTDGLASEVEWKGRVWINPGVKNINHGPWAERLLHEYQNGNVDEGLILLPACTNASYANKLRQFPRAFTTGPLKVSGPSLPEHLIKLPLMIIYVGPNKRFPDFAASFSTDHLDVFIRASKSI